MGCVRLTFLASVLLIHGSPAQTLTLTGPQFVDLLSGNSYWTLGTVGNNSVKFNYAGVAPILEGAPPPPNFIVVSPPSGVTPAVVEIGLNLNVFSYMQPGKYSLGVKFTTVDQATPSMAGGFVTLTVPSQPAPTIRSVVSTGSLQPLVAPGTIISIFGSSLAAPALVGAYDDTGSFPTTLGNTIVTFGGVAAPLLYVSANQINALIPYAVSGQKSVDVIVKHFSQSSAAFTLALSDTSPSIFTASQSGTGQAAVLDGSGFRYYTADNPAPSGSVFTVFATGAGAWNPAVAGDITLDAINFTAQSVSLTIGGRPAKILYAGTSPYQPWGLLQVNAFVPDGLTSGPQQMVLKVGQNDNSQQGVTIAIK